MPEKGRRVRDSGKIPDSAFLLADGGGRSLAATFNGKDMARINKALEIKRPMNSAEFLRFVVRRWLDDYGL